MKVLWGIYKYNHVHNMSLKCWHPFVHRKMYNDINIIKGTTCHKCHKCHDIVNGHDTVLSVLAFYIAEIRPTVRNF